MESEVTIKELIKVIVKQETEINELKSRIERIKEYIEVYEELLKRGN